MDLAGCDREKPDGVGRQSIKEEKYVKQSLSKLGYGYHGCTKLMLISKVRY